MMNRKTIAVTIGILAIVGADLAVPRVFQGTAAASDVQSTIDARRALMKDNGAKMKAMGAAIEAKSGDMATMQQLALALQANAAKIPELFPPGSSTSDLPGATYAKPDIWTSFDDFRAAAASLGTEAGKLADAAKRGDMAAFAAQYDVTGENGCGGCHTKFRQKKS
jgi:cytochrome c556